MYRKHRKLCVLICIIYFLTLFDFADVFDTTFLFLFCFFFLGFGFLLINFCFFGFFPADFCSFLRSLRACVSFVMSLAKPRSRGFQSSLPLKIVKIHAIWLQGFATDLPYGQGFEGVFQHVHLKAIPCFSVQ